MTELECEMMLYEEWEKESKEAERVYLRNLAAKIQEKDHCRPNGQETEMLYRSVLKLPSRLILDGDEVKPGK